MLVEPERLGILRVHIGCQIRMRRERSCDAGFADPIAMVIGIDKQRLQMPLVDKHEALRQACGIDGKL